MKNLLQSVFGKPAARPTAPARLGLEALGERALMSVSASVVGGVLTITGDAAANDVVVTHASLFGKYLYWDNNAGTGGNVPDAGVTAVDFLNRGPGDTLTNESGLPEVRRESGTVGAGVGYSFVYNPGTQAGTLTVNGTAGGDSFSLHERRASKDPDAPPVGISVLDAGTMSWGGVAFPAGSQIALTANGGGGNDAVTNTTRFPATINGGSGDDTLTGGRGADELNGGAGHDALSGGLGDDALHGDRDVFRGQYADVATGNDRLVGGWGSDVLNGGRGDDFLTGDQSTQHLSRGVGYVWVSQPGDATGTAGNDVLNGGDGRDVLVGGYGNDLLTGGVGEDWLFGGADDDTLQGGDDRDYLFGGSGTDTLYGGAAADHIRTGGSNDPFWGVNDYYDANGVYIPHGVTGDDNDPLMKGPQVG